MGVVRRHRLVVTDATADITRWTREVHRLTNKTYVRGLRAIQYRFRRRLFSDIASNPTLKTQLLRLANCPPSGCHVRPQTNPCHFSFVCPWCFVRDRVVPVARTIEAFQALDEPYDFAVEVRDVDHLPSDQWFWSSRAYANPHRTRSAYCTIQTLRYDYLRSRGDGLSHVAVQLLPPDSADPVNLFDTHSRMGVLRLQRPDKRDVEDILRVVFRYPSFFMLYAARSPRCIEHFTRCAGMRTLRVAVRTAFRSRLKDSKYEN